MWGEGGERVQKEAVTTGVRASRMRGRTFDRHDNKLAQQTIIATTWIFII